MIVCIICGKACKSWQGLAKHVKSAHGLDVYTYHRGSPAALAQLRERIAEMVDHEPAPYGHLQEPCWRWRGRLTRGGKGYGTLRLAGSPTEAAHRLSWWAHSGLALEEPPPPPEVVLMHQCDNGACVNPAHLVPGDHTSNMDERRERGRHHDCHASQLEEMDVHEIRIRARLGETHREIGERFGLSKSAICHTVAGRSFGHIVTPHQEPEPDFIPF